MRIYLSRSEAAADIYGFTTDAAGANLPQTGSWTSIGMLLIGDELSPPAKTALNQNGFYLAARGVTVTSSPGPENQTDSVKHGNLPL
jgi:hypothetical protein